MASVMSARSGYFTTASPPTVQAYHVLHVAFCLVPIIAGIDKFFDKLTQWDMYLLPAAAQALGTYVPTFMAVVGVIEIAAGIGVILRPRWFAYVVCVWLLCIVVNLLGAGWFDIALRDAALAAGAFALGRLATMFHTDIV